MVGHIRLECAYARACLFRPGQRERTIVQLFMKKGRTMKTRKQCKAMLNLSNHEEAKAMKRCQAYTASTLSEYCRACYLNLAALRRRTRRTSCQLREFVLNNLVAFQARSGDGVFKKLRTRNPDGTSNKEEKRWYSWMSDKGRRTAREKADMEELNALVNYPVGYRKRTRRDDARGVGQGAQAGPVVQGAQATAAAAAAAVAAAAAAAAAVYTATHVDPSGLSS